MKFIDVVKYELRQLGQVNIAPKTTYIIEENGEVKAVDVIRDINCVKFVSSDIIIEKG